jgi:hypothetical protein
MSVTIQTLQVILFCNLQRPQPSGAWGGLDSCHVARAIRVRKDHTYVAARDNTWVVLQGERD